jgi:hypothetical protein
LKSAELKFTQNEALKPVLKLRLGEWGTVM